MDAAAKTNLLGLEPEVLKRFFAALGEKPFRAGQVLQWMHRYGVDNFEAMTNLGKALRTRLAEALCIFRSQGRRGGAQ